MHDVHLCVTVDYQQIANGNIANQIHGFTIYYGKFILMIVIDYRYTPGGTVSCGFDRIARLVSVQWTRLPMTLHGQADVENYLRCFHCIIFKNGAKHHIKNNLLTLSVRPL